jgi:hypothetical protein
MKPCPHPAFLATLTLALLAWAPAAGADEGRRRAAVPPFAPYQQECAACHVAYPPGLLPAASWRRLTDTLDRHFGVDASLDAATTATLANWLAAHAAPSSLPAPPQDRITRSAWFVRKHDEVPADRWTLPAVKSGANCGACHTRANEGDFDERRIRIPR